MKRGKRKQHVVLRSKVRQVRMNKIRSFFSGKFVFLAASVGLSFALHRFLFVSDFFMIKSLQVSGADQEIAAHLRSKISIFKGKSAFSLNLGQAERGLMKQMPELGSLTMRRALPDGIKADFSLRRPVALLKMPPAGEKPRASNAAMDGDGVLFPADLSADEMAALPEVALPEPEARYSALAFLKSWNEAVLQNSVGGGQVALRKLTLDARGEVNVYIVSDSFPGELTRIVWGQFEAATFGEKYRRLGDVWKDIAAKQMPVEYVNLRGVPQSARLVLGEREVVGRVLIRPKTKMTQMPQKSDLKGI